MNKFNRIFLIIYDSFGIGQDPRAEEFGDKGANTYLNIKNSSSNLDIPFIESAGLCCLLEEGKECDKAQGTYYFRGIEESNAKESMSGHWELMGVVTKIPFPTFTETGFPKELIDALEKEWGKKIIGNVSASGTDIINKHGMEEIESKGEKVIVYTSNDPVLQICANEDVIGLDKLYEMSKSARKICDSKPEWKVGRIIARPYVGDSPENFKRTSNRHDYTVPPTTTTYLDKMKDAGIQVKGIGKIGDLFSMNGINDNVSTISNIDGLEKTLNIVKSDNPNKNEFVFVNLVEFDSEWGHRRNVEGYAKGLSEADKYLKEIFENSREDDLIIVSADHGNDPTYKGTDHTREMVPVIAYSKSFNSNGRLDDIKGFYNIGSTIADNFGVKTDLPGKSFLEKLK